jgi:diguanylate cyclase (GGDEF)-like protein
MAEEKKILKKKWNIRKAQSIRFRFLTTVIFAMLAITFFVGGLSIYEVDNYIQDQSEAFVKVTCTNEAERINNSLKNMERSVTIMESYLLDFFKTEADVEDREVQKQVTESAEKMFIDVVKHTSTAGAVAYYFRFDPAISDSKAGLFYSKQNGCDEFVSFEPTDLSAYDKDDTEHVGWFWQPYEKKAPVWMKPYHNQNNNILMISYVIPMYFGEKFIGVVGMDFDYKALETQVNGIEIYENGFACLELDGAILSDDKGSSDAKGDIDSQNYLRVSEKLTNGMTLALFASYDDIRQTRNDIGIRIFFIVLVLSIVFTLIAALVVQRISNPLKNLTNAAIKLSNGDYNVELVKSDAYEIKLLNSAFEDMVIYLREREEHLHLSANRDSMTGLRNTTSYASWVARFDKELAESPFDFGIVVFDLNNLKKTNDTYGHEVGDKLIVTSAKIISDVFKRSPVFRIGGDEFLAVLQNNDLENHHELLEALSVRCRNTFINENKQIPIDIAFGLAQFEAGKDLKFQDVFNRADQAMYENKREVKPELYNH